MNKRFIVSFIDVALLLALTFLFLSQQETHQGKSANRQTAAAIFVFIEETAHGFQARCNGRYHLIPQEMIEIATTKNHGRKVRKVLIIASIEGNVPYSFWHRYKMAIDYYNLKLKQSHCSRIILQWDTQLLGNR
jgi:hypothetical protein